jgi:hypothetical protein
MVKREHLIRKLPGLMVDGFTTDPKNLYAYQNTRKKLHRLERRNPPLFEGLIRQLDRDVEAFRKASLASTVPKRGWLDEFEYRLRSVDFEFPVIDAFFEKKKGKSG